jgi:hypothetical protein
MLLNRVLPLYSTAKLSTVIINYGWAGKSNESYQYKVEKLKG